MMPAISILAVTLQVFACSGLGAVLLRAINLHGLANAQTRALWALALGVGILAWLTFFIGLTGHLNKPSIMALLGVCALGNLAFWRIHDAAPLRQWRPSCPLGGIDYVLILCIAAVALLDLFEALAPPADADSLAYHFSLPKLFLDLGALVFVPRAVDGATPMLLHMTYANALALGSTQAMTLWTMFLGYLPAALLFATARLFLNSRWSLALVLAFLTTPAVIYGGGSGQIEIKVISFVLLASVAIMLAGKAAPRGDAWKWVLLAGLCAGFYGASKHFGLFFMAAGGIAVLLHVRAFKAVCVYSFAALVAACQWYLWIYTHTGDPVFPALYGVLTYPDASLWSSAHDLMFKTRAANLESALPVTPITFAAYPFIATFAGIMPLEGGRVGIGPLAFILLLPTLFACWSRKTQCMRHPLVISLTIVIVFYTLWFLLGPSQRLRHLVPIYPIALLILSVAAASWYEKIDKLGRIGFEMAWVMLIIMQLGGAGLFASSYIKRIVDDIPQDTFLTENVPHYSAVPSINALLRPDDLIATNQRQLEFYLQPRVFFVDTDDTRIDIVNDDENPQRFYNDLRAQGVTHLLVIHAQGADIPAHPAGFDMWWALSAADCTEELDRLPSHFVSSRTLQGSAPSWDITRILRLKETCPALTD